jgi:hypothetical protein
MEIPTDLALIAGLNAKLHEIEQRLAAYMRKMKELEAVLSTHRAVLQAAAQHVDGVSYLPHLSVRRVFGRGEMQRYCLEALEAAGHPLDTRELAEYAIRSKGMDADDVAIRKKVIGSVQQAMKTARRYRRARSLARRRGVIVWALW